MTNTHAQELLTLKAIAGDLWGEICVAMGPDGDQRCSQKMNDINKLIRTAVGSRETADEMITKCANTVVFSRPKE